MCHTAKPERLRSRSCGAPAVMRLTAWRVRTVTSHCPAPSAASPSTNSPVGVRKYDTHRVFRFPSGVFGIGHKPGRSNRTPLTLSARKTVIYAGRMPRSRLHGISGFHTLSVSVSRCLSRRTLTSALQNAIAMYSLVVNCLS